MSRTTLAVCTATGGVAIMAVGLVLDNDFLMVLSFTLLLVSIFIDMRGR